MDLHLVRLIPTDNSKTIATLNKALKSPVLFSYSLCFLRQGDEFEALTNDRKRFEHWRELLAALLIQHSFHADFNVLKMIGKGSFGKVYLAQRKAAGKLFAVKAFNKDFLTSNTNKGKVSSPGAG